MGSRPGPIETATQAPGEFRELIQSASVAMPGDTLIITLASGATVEQVEKFAETTREALKDSAVKAVVLCGDVSITIARGSDA